MKLAGTVSQVQNDQQRMRQEQQLIREDLAKSQMSVDLLLRASGLVLEPAKPPNEPVGRATPGESARPTAGPAVPPSD